MTLKPSAADGSALEWIKSSHSTDDGPSCVELAATPDTVHVRDSKNRQGPQLAVAPAAWAGFISHVSRPPGTGQ